MAAMTLDIEKKGIMLLYYYYYYIFLRVDQFYWNMSKFGEAVFLCVRPIISRNFNTKGKPKFDFFSVEKNKIFIGVLYLSTSASIHAHIFKCCKKEKKSGMVKGNIKECPRDIYTTILLYTYTHRYIDALRQNMKRIFDIYKLTLLLYIKLRTQIDDSHIYS